MSDYTGSSNLVVYADLQPGEYAFTVVANASDGDSAVLTRKFWIGMGTHLTLPTSLKKQKLLTKVNRLILNPPYKFLLETMTMMTPYGVIGWERVNTIHPIVPV